MQTKKSEALCGIEIAGNQVENTSQKQNKTKPNEPRSIAYKPQQCERERTIHPSSQSASKAWATDKNDDLILVRATNGV